MKVLFFIDRFSEDAREGAVVALDGKLWLIAPMPGEIDKPISCPVRLIRLDSLPR